MSAANGHTGMVLDLDYLGLALCLGRFSVQLQVRPESAEALSQALVAASLR